MKFAIFYILAAATFSCVGNLLLKYGQAVDSQNSFLKTFSPFFIIASVFFLINMIFFSRSLTFLPVSVAYPILSSVSFSLLAVASFVIFGEKLTVIQYIGAVTILLGIVLLSSGIE